jgi:hypothetical protein
MVALTEFLNTLKDTKSWCAGDISELIDKSAADIYNGTRHPGLWCVVLAYTNLSAAKDVLVTAIHNAAGALEDSELKTRMLVFNTGMTAQELDDLMSWVEPRRRLGLPPFQAQSFKVLCSALFTAAKMLKSETPELMMRSINDLVKYKMLSEEKSKETAIIEFYAFLHGEVDLSSWMGSYT